MKTRTLKTRNLITHARQNIRYITPPGNEEARARTKALALLTEFNLLYADLLDAIDRDDTSAAYNAVDILIDTVRIANGKARPHVAAAD